MKFRNVSPLGALFIPAIGREVEAGEEFDGPESLLDQPENFERADDSNTTTTDAAPAQNGSNA